MKADGVEQAMTLPYISMWFWIDCELQDCESYVIVSKQVTGVAY